jgi:hypothetical protein
MGYFSNGDEGDLYEHNVCSRCAHHNSNPEEEGCVIWTIHLLYNYDQHKSETIKDVLSGLIPRSNVPGYNDLCSMYHPSKPEYAEHGNDYKAWLKSKEKPQP